MCRGCRRCRVRGCVVRARASQHGLHSVPRLTLKESDFEHARLCLVEGVVDWPQVLVVVDRPGLRAV